MPLPMRLEIDHREPEGGVPMENDVRSIGSRSATGLLDECPACGSARLALVSDGDEANFLCEGCGRCWHVNLGRVSRVDPIGCPGCPHRAVCMARVALDATPSGLGS
jgi:DNA-directed RNA polymerase subunit RPC12/RpoP